MPSNYEAITRHNERQLGLDTASRKTQICMYSDSTHFVYEILQNADDYSATEVFFKLSKDELLVEHNGEPFTEDNVKAITYFGKSTSRDDLVKTGRFGVGFKSVFAFTATPVIISNDEHFQIYGLYRVKGYPYSDDYPRFRTCIILPFDHESKQPDYVENLISPAEAYSKISTRLTGMNMNTLLFTRNIREIRWEIAGRSGHYLREDSMNGNARWTTITDGEKLNKYLVFSRVPQWKNQKYKAVEVAFAVDDKNQLAPIDDLLYVLFATTQETHLQFILNGPYRTNPSRETISEDDHFNVHLMKETCALMKDMLPQLREMGLLTPAFLGVLPNGNDKLRDFYTPLLDTIIETFRQNALVPTDDNRYASASDVFQGPAPIREVVSREELPFFVSNENACWAKGVQQNSRADQFLRDLGIEQWGWKQLEEALKDKYSDWYSYHANEDDNTWLASRSDSWLQKLYILLADAIRKDECSERTLKNCRIIRVLKGGDETHVAGSKAYFQKRDRSYKDLPQIKHAILRGRNEQADKKIQESLIALGVSEIGDEERIDFMLETFYGEESTGVPLQQHLKHMSFFIKWWKREKSASKFEDYAIFYSAGNNVLQKAEDCFLDAPLQKSGLHVIYSIEIPTIPKKVKLWSGYSKLLHEGFCEFAVACGIVDRLLIHRRSCRYHPEWDQMIKGRRGAYESSKKIDDDYYIVHLKDLLRRRDHRINLLIWNTISKADPEILKAAYSPNKQYDKRQCKSSLVLELADAEWVPDKSGRFLKPCDLTKEQLHSDFKFDNRNGWLDAVGFGESAKKRSEEYLARNKQAQEIGFASADEAHKMAELAKLLKDNGKSPDDLILQFRSETNKEKPAFPKKSLSNAERRREKLLEQLKNASDKKYEQRSRSDRTTRGTIDPDMWLRNHYTNEADEMVCQICKEEMPFRKRNGEYYFEAVEAFSRDHLAKEHEAQFLALCPLCAAMYKEFVKQDEDAMETLKTALMNSDEPEVSLQLGGLNTSVRFVESHFEDIKTILREMEGDNYNKLD